MVHPHHAAELTLVYPLEPTAWQSKQNPKYLSAEHREGDE